MVPASVDVNGDQIRASAGTHFKQVIDNVLGFKPAMRTATMEAHANLVFLSANFEKFRWNKIDNPLISLLFIVFKEIFS